MTLCALFGALIALCSWLCVPIGDIAFTMQTFAVFLTLGLLGGKWGTVTILVYLLLGAVGMPVFTAFRGGIGVLAGVTGGYLWGFLFSGLIYWILESRSKLLAMAAGQLICYACGTAWFASFSGGGLGFILLRCVVPFLIPDILKLALALHLTNRLRKFIRLPSQA